MTIPLRNSTCYSTIDRRGLALVLWVLTISARAGAADLAETLKQVPTRIVYETWQDNNWELFAVRPDGSEMTNLTKTPDRHELYPHVSPDGRKISFRLRRRYGSRQDPQRIRDEHGRNGPQAGGYQCAAAVLERRCDRPGLSERRSGAVYIHRLCDPRDFLLRPGDGRHTQHPNKELLHLYNPCWTPDGKWCVATVHAGMGYTHAILAFEADGSQVYDLQIPGCRPDISPGRKADRLGCQRLGDLRGGPRLLRRQSPRCVNARDVVTSEKPMKAIMPTGRPAAGTWPSAAGRTRSARRRFPKSWAPRPKGGISASPMPSQTNRWLPITTDGNCNKEPDWIPLAEGTP